MLAPEVRSQFAQTPEDHAHPARVRSRALFRQVAGHRGEPLHPLRAGRGRAEPDPHSQDVRDPARVAQRASGLCGVRDRSAFGPRRALPRRRRGRSPQTAAGATSGGQGRTPSARWPGAWPARRWPSATSRRQNQGRGRPAGRRCARPARSFAACRPSPSSTVAELVDDPALRARRRQAQGRARGAHPRLHRERQRGAAARPARADRLTCGSRRPSPCRPRRSLLAATASISSIGERLLGRLQGDLQRQRFLALRPGSRPRTGRTR